MASLALAMQTETTHDIREVYAPFISSQASFFGKSNDAYFEQKSVETVVFRMENRNYVILSFLSLCHMQILLNKKRDSFNAQDRFEAKEDYIGLCGISGYIFETQNDQETVLQWF